MATTEPDRIISLVPAATEILFVVGATDRLVGVSHECDFPPAVEGLPRLTRSKIDTGGSSAEIDRAVKELSQRGDPLFHLDGGLLEALEPDLIVAQTDCDVCAVSPDDVRAAIEDLDPKPDIFEFRARSYEESLAMIRTLGARAGERHGMEAEMVKQWGLAKQIRGATSELDRPRVAVLDWIDPLMFAGHWTNELVEMGGGRYGLVPTGQPSRWGDWDELRDFEPEVIVISPCGRSLEDTRREAGAIFSKPDVAAIPAVADGRVFVADGSHYFNRAGPRLVYSAALLARAMHPEHVPPLPERIEAAMAPLVPAA